MYVKNTILDLAKDIPPKVTDLKNWSKTVVFFKIPYS